MRNHIYVQMEIKVPLSIKKRDTIYTQYKIVVLRKR